MINLILQNNINLFSKAASILLNVFHLKIFVKLCENQSDVILSTFRIIKLAFLSVTGNN